MRNFIKLNGLLLFLAFGLVFGAVAQATTNPVTQDARLIIDDPLTADRLGMSVAVDGDTAIIGGAGANRGQAFVFARDSAGVWSKHQTLAVTTYVGARYGISVALEGDTAMVGADRYWIQGGGGGAVFVYKRDSAGVWSQHQILNPNDTSRAYPTGDHFGHSIALDGNTVVIGASHDNNNYPSSLARAGSAYVFEYDPVTDSWIQQQEFIASDMLDLAGAEFFGKAVALDGDVAAVGSVRDYVGAVYVFERDSTGAWSEQQILVADGLVGRSFFGESLGLAGDTIIAGAMNDGDPYEAYGTAYVFTRDSTGTWSEQQELRPSDWGPYSVSRFGHSLAMEGSTVVIGAPYTTHSGVGGAGAAYLFTESGGVWSEQAKLIASDPAQFDNLGGGPISTGAIGMSGSTILVGAPLRDTGGVTDAGAAYVFSYITNTPPIAEAGVNQSIHVGDLVLLDGSGSSDAETDSLELVYTWQFEQVPSGSLVELIDANDMYPSFTPDVTGDYVISLVVTDEGDFSSEPDEVLVSSLNTPPNADAGEDQGALVWSDVYLDGSGSYDPDGDSLSYAWSMQQMPEGSMAELNDADSMYPSFTPDLAGAYNIELIVNDAYADSDPDTVSVLVADLDDYICERMSDAVNLVADMPKSSFSTKGNKKALSNFLRLRCENAQLEELDEAQHKLEQALSRTDGCILRGAVDESGGGPAPKKDFIINCYDQEVIYPLVLEALESLAVPLP